VLVNRSTSDGTLADAENRLSTEALNTEMMEGLGFSSDFARSYAKAYTNAGFQREYKLKTMSVSWDTEEGASFDLTGANYIVARVDRPTSAGTEQS